MNKSKLLFIFFYCIINLKIFPQPESLRLKIADIISSIDGKTGVAVIALNQKDTLTFFGNDRFPMQSVYKFPLALAVLNEVDKGNLTLEDTIFIKKTDLLEDTWSPLRDKYPEGNIYITLDQLLAFTVSHSDNNGCDILFRLLGGTGEVEKYIHSLGIRDIAVSATEEEMHEDWDTQFTNWCTPYAMGLLLMKLFSGEILSKNSQEYLWEKMVNTTTGANRIIALLPEGTNVAHKTGSSSTNDDGVTAATNDAGIVKLSDGNYFAIVVFVSDSKSDVKTREGIIAQISKAVWDYYSEK